MRRTWDSDVLAAQVTMRYRTVVRFDSHGKETKVPIQFGAIPVELPDIPDVPLHLVVVKGFGTHPISLLSFAYFMSRTPLMLCACLM